METQPHVTDQFEPSPGREFIRTPPELRAGVLIEALPYLREFYGKTLVIKYGGNAMIDDRLKEMVMQDVALMHYVGIRPIVVHGGGPEITALMKQMGHEPTFIGGLRVTDAATMEIVEMALTGKTNKSIVALLNRQGAKAVGLSGKDANLIVARKLESEVGDLGFVGEITQINAGILNLLSDQGYVPVISTVAIGEDGESYNVNADHAAGALAAQVKAAKLIVLTDVEGLYRDFSDKSSLISELSDSDAQAMVDSGQVDKGMIPKLEACVEAVEGGVPRAHLIDGRQPHAILIEVFTDTGIGTMIRSSESAKDLTQNDPLLGSLDERWNCCVRELLDHFDSNLTQFDDSQVGIRLKEWLDGNDAPLSWTGDGVTADEWFFITTLYGQLNIAAQRSLIRKYFDPLFVHDAKRDIRKFDENLVTPVAVNPWMKQRLCTMGALLRERRLTMDGYVERLRRLDANAVDDDPTPALDTIIHDHKAGEAKTLSVFIRDCVLGQCFPIDRRVRKLLSSRGIPENEKELVRLCLRSGRNPRFLARLFYEVGG